MQIVDHLLVQRVVDVTKSVPLAFDEITLRSVDQLVLVRWKGGFHRKRTSEIGDGMSLIIAHRRPCMVYQLDPVWTLRGLTLYQEYDETTDHWSAYLYGYKKDPQKIERLNSLLAGLHVAASVQQVNRYLQVDAELPMRLPLDKMARVLHMGLGKAMASFLFGCVLAYGEFITEEHVLHQARISLPLVGTIVEQSELLDVVYTFFADHGVYIARNRRTGAQGEIYEMTISDPELLLSFAKWLQSVEGEIIVAGFERMQSVKAQLQEFLRTHAVDATAQETIEYSVIKLLNK